ncbi:hypothetical protein [Myceligenerans pegani]|uniref:Uncharacterized protein n=1 Tax=Myceligenerans pegani TaxID=2776917 RepID=A0ABR9MUB5_9MICO|nr:hypothetical protein [Myceligenerans sp. TRM 65318]MBE1874357.1 hypothetical protein [Myceligenerans sp. TRM 65318]MBE3016628.1 hypothetical protein [Myceligenerans sp. TRM 65318]
MTTTPRGACWGAACDDVTYSRDLQVSDGGVRARVRDAGHAASGVANDDLAVAVGNLVAA